MMRGGKGSLESTPGTDKFISVLNRISMKLESKIGCFDQES